MTKSFPWLRKAKKIKSRRRRHALLLGLASITVFAQSGSDFFHTERQLFPIYSSQVATPHPFDNTQPLDARVRSYLDGNCAYCHQPGRIERGGLDFRFSTPLDRTALFAPSGRSDANGGILFHIQPGNTQASDIYLRLASIGPDAMPPLGRTQVDKPGLALMREWIESLSTDTLPAAFPQTKKSTPSIPFLQRRTLELELTGIDPEGMPAFRILDVKGKELPGIFVSADPNPGRTDWTLRFSQLIPRGRYWIEVKWVGGGTIRDILVL